MRQELERSFSIFELDVYEKLGIKPTELEEMDMFTLHCWITEKSNRLIKQQQKLNFDRLKQNGITRNQGKTRTRIR